ncbi:MAG: hypothetical protein A3I66_10480 [Burkholderiales bacterium RIFCSPLOWO2_02_FULL_57_36]|nr:MAG: hypothetical protein A3I66_10480 [Burkholderiales bacterium RIFCSPLOWO2_02_FULL_57_36]
MLMGHYSSALVAKRIAPSLSLPLLFVSSQLIDFFWGILVLFGIEKLHVIPGFNPSNPLDLYFMPYTHSLPAAIIWSGGAAVLYYLFAKTPVHRVRNALLIGAVVGSHWILDFIVHLPDLPLWYDSFKVGLGLWNFRYIALALELLLVWGAIIACRKIAGENHWRYVLMAIVMSAVQISTLIMPPPLTGTSVVLQLLAAYMALTILGHWASKPRQTE